MDRLSKLTAWLFQRMAAYHAGGVPYNIAARFTLGELRACYRGQHWSGGKLTKPPDIPAEEAAARARYALMEIKEAYGADK
jgi:hypothetical protein